MSISSLPALSPVPPGPQDPAARAVPDRGASLEEAAAGLESLFLSLLVKEMRQTLEPGGLFAGNTGDVYGGMFDLYLGQHLAGAGGLGLAESLKRQLGGPKQS